MRTLTYAISGSILGCAFGAVSGFVYKPFADWWFGGFTLLLSLVISIVLSAIILVSLLNENLGLAATFATIFIIPTGTIIATNGILLITNIIFSVVFAILGMRSFGWAISGLTPTESEKLAGSIFSNGLTIGGVILSIIAGILIVALTALICAAVPQLLIREKVFQEPNPREKYDYVS